MKVIHILKLSGIGGVQSQFEIFYNNLTEQEKKDNLICNIGNIDLQYQSLKAHCASKYKCLKEYLFDATILHSYNNLTSKKYFKLFRLIRPKMLIYHEHGNAWNISSKEKELILSNSKMAQIIICNSKATKILLNKKFNIPNEKLKVIYNGVISQDMISKIPKFTTINTKFIVGYVGRIDTNKGIQSVIKAMKYLDSNKYELHIIGDGILKNKFEKYVKELDLTNVFFFGRKKDAWLEMTKFNCLVVPSIREPLGNVIIEAGLLKIPVIASSVDGIPEIISHNNSGILIKPKECVDERFVSSKVPLPEFVVDVNQELLVNPKQLLAEEVAEYIKLLACNKNFAQNCANELYQKVIYKFGVDSYNKELFNTYKSILSTNI